MAAPAIPSRIQPANGAVLTGLPLFKVNAPGANRVYLRLKTPARRWLTVLEMTREGTTDIFRHQLRAPGVSKSMTFQFNGTAVRGSYRFRLFSGVSEWLPYNEADLSKIQAAIFGLPDFGQGYATVSGRPYQTSGLVVTLTNNRNAMFQARDFYMGWSADVYGLKTAAGGAVGMTITTTTEGTGDLPSSTGNPNGYGDWYWDVIARGADGLFRAIDGGDTTNPREAAAAGDTMFWYSAAPTLTVTRPTAGQVFAGDAPLVQWSVGGTSTGTPIVYQEVNFVRASDGVQVWVAASDTVRPGDNARHPATILDPSLEPDATEYRLPKRILRNDTAYRVSFRAINEAGQEALLVRDFTILYGPPAAVATFTGVVSGTSAWIDTSWVQVGSAYFSAYLIKWRPAEVGWDSDQVRTIYRTANRLYLTTRVLEFPLGRPFVLGHFVEIVDASGEVQTSVAKEWSPPGGAVMARVTVLSQVAQSGRKVVVLPARRMRSVPSNFNRNIRQPWNQQYPVVQGDKAFNHTYTGTYPIYVAGNIQAQMTTIATLEAMAREQYPIFVKDFYGRAFYGALLAPLNVDDPEDYSYQEVSLTIEETAQALDVTYG